MGQTHIGGNLIMANIPGNLPANSTGSLINTVGEAIENSDTGIDEKIELDNEISKANMQYEMQMAALEHQKKQANPADNAIQNRAQESRHPSWLATNIHPILAVCIIGLTFFMYCYIAFSDGSSNKIMAPDSPMRDIVIYMTGALTTVAIQVVSYFFGSSSGSANMGKELNFDNKERI
jgi:uncharacterized membrane protein YjjP (DUF1212 family)